MKKCLWFNLFLVPLSLVVFLVSLSFSLVKQQDNQDLDAYRQVSEFVDENERCFKCHDNNTEVPGPEAQEKKDSLNLKESQIITREEFYQSNHKSLACIGCHTDEDPDSEDNSDESTAESRTCTDCHLHIKKHQHYQFAVIEEEYLQSIHHKRKPDDFSCYKCHNPHTFKIHIRNTENFQEAISYDNSICLSCHIYANPFLVSDNAEATDTVRMHQWLSEQETHLRNIRCIDCHTRENEFVLVAHMVLPKEESVRNCSECHSSNSLLITTLYKNRTINKENQNGLFNSVVTEDVFVLGGNRSKTLNNISLIIFAFVLIGILFHMIPRIVRKNKS